MLRLMGKGWRGVEKRGGGWWKKEGGIWHRRDQTTGFLFSSFTGEVIGKLLRFV